jgi:hypothetical protein
MDVLPVGILTMRASTELDGFVRGTKRNVEPGQERVNVWDKQVRIYMKKRGYLIPTIVTEDL